MKKIFVILLVCAMGGALFAENGGGTRLGVQLDSDTFAGVLVYTGRLELGLRAQAVIDDGGDGNLRFGGHAAFLFPAGDGSSVSAGLTGGSYIGVPEYAEYVDLGLRIGFNQMLGEHVLLSGILYPISIHTEETEGADDWSLTATFPAAAVAVAWLF